MIQAVNRRFFTPCLQKSEVGVGKNMNSEFIRNLSESANKNRSELGKRVATKRGRGAGMKARQLTDLEIDSQLPVSLALED